VLGETKTRTVAGERQGVLPMDIQQVNLTDPEKIFMARYNNTATALLSGQVIEFVASDDAEKQGYEVRGVNALINATTGISAELAGVTTAAVAATTRFTAQVYGPVTIKTSTTYAAGRLAIASSVSATVKASVDVQTTTTTAAYAQAALGIVLDEPSAAECVIQLRTL